MKVIAAIAAFLFLALAATFGSSASSVQASPLRLTLSILAFVAGTSLLMGIVFGRAALRVTTISGGLALFIMWLPLQYYATEESFILSATALLLITLAQIPLYFVGSIARACFEVWLQREY